MHYRLLDASWRDSEGSAGAFVILAAKICSFLILATARQLVWPSFRPDRGIDVTKTADSQPYNVGSRKKKAKWGSLLSHWRFNLLNQAFRSKGPDNAPYTRYGIYERHGVTRNPAKL